MNKAVLLRILLLLAVPMTIFLYSYFYYFLPHFSEQGYNYLPEKKDILRHDVNLSISEKANFRIQIASTPQERLEGLSGVSNITDQEGMLFIFEKPDKYGFWMKDMNFALDIIWIDENMKVVGVEKNVPPQSYPSKILYPSLPALYVLEIKSGLAEKYGINTGDNVVLTP